MIYTFFKTTIPGHNPVIQAVFNIMDFDLARDMEILAKNKIDVSFDPFYKPYPYYGSDVSEKYYTFPNVGPYKEKNKGKFIIENVTFEFICYKEIDSEVDFIEDASELLSIPNPPKKIAWLTYIVRENGEDHLEAVAIKVNKEKKIFDKVGKYRNHYGLHYKEYVDFSLKFLNKVAAVKLPDSPNSSRQYLFDSIVYAVVDTRKQHFDNIQEFMALLS